MGLGSRLQGEGVEPLSNQGEKSINSFFIMVPLRIKSIIVWYSKAQSIGLHKMSSAYSRGSYKFLRGLCIVLCHGVVGRYMLLAASAVLHGFRGCSGGPSG